MRTPGEAQSLVCRPSMIRAVAKSYSLWPSVGPIAVLQRMASLNEGGRLAVCTTGGLGVGTAAVRVGVDARVRQAGVRLLRNLLSSTANTKKTARRLHWVIASKDASSGTLRGLADLMCDGSMQQAGDAAVSL